jgi:predicted HTH transcriptional regulator
VDTEELEQRLDGGQETPTFEVKTSMPWNHRTLARDILAMANVRDGGVILIGVEDGSFQRVGVDEATRQTYDAETMRDQMAQYADPHVQFTVGFPSDRDGLRYVAIQVTPFVDTPVICRRDSADTRAGAIYYRSASRRVESAEVRSSYDMRDIVTVASIRMRQRLEALGVLANAPSQTLAARLDEELGDL